MSLVKTLGGSGAYGDIYAIVLGACVTPVKAIGWERRVMETCMLLSGERFLEHLRPQ